MSERRRWTERGERLRAAAAERILVLDGAMGTMLQTLGLDEQAFRGERFAGHARALRGCNDLLVLTQPERVAEVHRAYLRAGADIVETNTFNATAISLADYALEEVAREINFAAARLARIQADAESAATPDRPRFVAGSLGPTNKSASLSPRVEDPGARAVTFDQLRAAYRTQAEGLLAGGVDLLLVETVFDTVNAKAALAAIGDLFDALGEEVPVVVSATITDQSGRTLAGQTLEAFWIAIAPYRPFAVALNCALGAAAMRPHVEELARLAETRVGCWPNAGLPNELGAYDETPAFMAGVLGEMAAAGWLNLVGGCCGTTPAHIEAIAAAVRGAPVRAPAPPRPFAAFSGLEPLVVRPDSNFILIGERTNVTGSRAFARLVKSGDFEGALAVARQQVEGGANVLDVCMDEALLDGPAAMTRFLNLVASEPEVARLPIMVDSSDFRVIEAGLKTLSGKGIVNSLSLKEGEAKLLEQAERVRRLGAAVVLMAFDEKGQATSAARKVEILSRAVQLLVDRVGFAVSELVLDPAVLAVGTGLVEHADYALAFFAAVRELKARFPEAKISGGISNVSFAFRGHEPVRQAINACFLYHAIRAGLDMGIVNAGQLAVYDALEPGLRERVEDLLLNRRADATERLLAHASGLEQADAAGRGPAEWRALPVDERLRHALVHGVTDHLAVDLAEALAVHGEALAVIEGPLLAGMSDVGERFAAGKMFLPQVVKSARVMKRAVAELEPRLREHGAAARARAKVLLATVRGDVHDIGKNIVGVVLGCNGYEVIDLGVMVPAEAILDRAAAEGAAVVGLSGLITPSLEEMTHVATAMQRRGMTVPLLIGGATTSAKHTALKIAPAYQGPVLHVRDASQAAGVIGELLGPEQAALVERNRARQQELRDDYAGLVREPLLGLAQARDRRLALSFADEALARPDELGVRVLRPVPLAELVPYVDWTPFFHVWELRGVFPAILDKPGVGPQAREVYGHGRAMLEELVATSALEARAVYGFFPANRDGDDVVLWTDERRREARARLYCLRQQRPDREACRSLGDYVAPAPGEDYLGAFAVSAGFGLEALVERFTAEHDDYRVILVKALADRLAEALAEWLHLQARRACGFGREENLGPSELLAEKFRGIRPAPGYPACPDHREKRTLFGLLEVERQIGMRLTESCAMWPAAAVSGWYFNHPAARYFAVGRVGRDQLEDYAARRQESVAENERWLAASLG